MDQEQSAAPPLPPQPPNRSAWLTPQTTTAAEALRDFWTKAFIYRGRAIAAEYNWPLLAFVVGAFVPGVLYEAGLPRPIALILDAALWLAFVPPWFSLIARRFHDMNRSGWFGLLMLVPFFGFIVTEGFLIFGGSDPRGVRFD